MCRQFQLWGGLMIAFGAGVLIGLWLKSGFISYLLGFGTILIGIGILRRN